MGKLLDRFAVFWTRNGQSLAKDATYKEAVVQLVTQGFIQGIVNGSGSVDREYGLGRGRTDLRISKNYAGADGNLAEQEEVVEIKVHRDEQRNPLPEAKEQLDTYLGQVGRDHGYAIIFDHRDSAIRERPAPVVTSETSDDGREITVLLLSP